MPSVEVGLSKRFFELTNVAQKDFRSGLHSRGRTRKRSSWTPQYPTLASIVDRFALHS